LPFPIIFLGWQVKSGVEVLASARPVGWDKKRPDAKRQHKQGSEDWPEP
jgi:hypothetical protein